jgi:raffinose/stachyose/melibiose transport system permease protein
MVVNNKTYKKVLLFLVLLFIALFYIIPIMLMVLGSLKTQGEALKLNLSLPKKMMFSNYAVVFAKGNVLRCYLNSLIITSGTVIITLFGGSLAGIIIARRSSKFTNKLYYFFLFGLTITLQIVTTFALLRALHIYGTYLGVILIMSALNMPLTVMTVTSFVHSVPRSIDEAAIIDGCSPLNLIWRILLPILKPIMLTNLILVAINAWNNFSVPLYFMSSSQRWPIPLMVYNFFGRYARDWQYVFAALVITVLPIVFLFLLLQKYIVDGMVNGAVKG